MAFWSTRQAEAYHLLNTHWGYNQFRPLQEAIIEAAVNGHDLLAILPTGGGKSICYQIAGLLHGKLTLVISPLIALMTDQVQNLVARGIEATFVNHTISKKECIKRLDACQAGNYRFLYLSPERLKSEYVLGRLPTMNVRLLVIDEAHCVSQWGHDFRPAYLRILPLAETYLPNVPRMAFTATATPAIRLDISKCLGLRKPQVFIGDFRRPGLRLVVLYDQDHLHKIQEILQKIPGSAIIYTRTRKATHYFAQWLEQIGIPSAAYHGGMNPEERANIQSAWLNNTLRVIVATSAFGLGVDKPDVRTVIHVHLPPDLESYWQEVGRAGRDGQTAYGVLFFRPTDAETLNQFVTSRFPTWQDLRAVYQHINEVCRIDKISPPTTHFPANFPKWAKDLNIAEVKLKYALAWLSERKIIQLQTGGQTNGHFQIILPPQTIKTLWGTLGKTESVFMYAIRRYGGEAFSKRIPVNLSRWAIQLRMTQAEVNEALLDLAKQTIIEYTPPTDEDTIQFLVPYHTLTPDAVNFEVLNGLHRQAVRRAASLIAYASGTDRCRYQVLQTYFGEKNTPPCLRCDVCTGRHRPHTDTKTLKQVRLTVLALLQTHPQGLYLKELFPLIPQANEATIEVALQQLLDNEDIVVTPTMKLILN